MSESTKVKVGDKVSLHYVGKYDSGEEFDSTHERKSPITIVVGAGLLIPGFENALVDMEVGTTKSVNIGPAEAYGDRKEERMAEIPAQNFPPQVLGQLEEGHIVPLSAEGNPNASFPATVLEVTEEFVRVDLNHPLAGKELTYDIELLSIEEAQANTEGEENE